MKTCPTSEMPARCRRDRKNPVTLRKFDNVLIILSQKCTPPTMTHCIYHTVLIVKRFGDGQIRLGVYCGDFR